MNKFFTLIKQNKDELIKPIAVLLAICIIIPLALSLTNMITVDRIKELSIKKETQTMQGLIDADFFKKANLDDGTEYHIAQKDGKDIGYIFITSAKGYGGEVSVMTAVEADGVVKSVAILNAANETPGLGQNVTKENFYTQYSGKKSGVVIVKNGADEEKNEINAVTGATISSIAVTNAVNEALSNFNKVFFTINNDVETEVGTDEK